MSSTRLPPPWWKESPSGASLACRYCGTIYDNHPEFGYVPPIGDGCEMCDPQSEDDE